MQPSNIMKNENYHTVGTFPNPIRKIIERGKINTPNTYIQDHSLTWLGTDISKSGGVNLVL